MTEALQMCRRLYPVNKFALGHPHLGECLQTVGSFRMRRGDYAEASANLAESLAMFERLYRGAIHPQTAEGLRL